ncbi:WhiB family transcriptional regulator [Streptomyces sp. 2.9]|uniref:WhiB family transcriptional regulator n=1 Tax=Streptomyces tritrimontium TaxID=3406573 RepID=UPI003BB71D82
MTSTQARRMRRPVLQAEVDAGAGCVGAHPDMFFRGDGAPLLVWQEQRAEALRFCHGCPARAACEELALRDGDGTKRDEMVRGGLSGTELAARRKAQARRISAAIAADTASGEEWNKLTDLTAKLHRAAGLNRRPEFQAQHNERVDELRADLAAVRASRRARTGWEVAA